MMQQSIIQDTLVNFYYRIEVALLDFPVGDIIRLVEAINTVRENGSRVYTMGNGGSSATASHFASDLGKGATNATKPRIKAICLADIVPAMTAWANDTEYSNIFAGQLDGVACAGDIVIALSVGGNSPNVVEGLRKAKDMGAQTVAIVGRDGGEAAKLADIVVKVPEWDTERVEDLHSMVCHSVTCCLRKWA